MKNDVLLLKILLILSIRLAIVVLSRVIDDV